MNDKRQTKAQLLAELSALRQRVTQWEAIDRQRVTSDQTSDALRQTETNLKKVEAAARVGHWTWDLRSNHVSWSDEMYRIFGLNPIGFSGDLDKVIQAAIHPDDRAKVAQANVASGAGQPAPLEYRVVWPDGSVRTVYAEPAEQTRDAQGNIVRLWGIVQDVTERQQSKVALHDSQAKLVAALESMTDAVFISDIEGRFIDFNEAFATFHKFRNKADCATTLAEYPEFLDVFMANGELAPLDQWAVPRALRGETGANVEYGLRRKDTGETWVGSYSFAPIRNTDGLIVGSVVVGRDITERKQAEEDLRVSEEKFRNLVEQMGEVFYAIDAEGSIQYVSPSVQSLLGFSPDDLSGRNVFEFIHPADQGKVLQGIEDALQGIDYSTEFRIADKAGSFRWVSSSNRAVFRNGQPPGLQGIIQDITERKRAEEDLRESEGRFRLLAENSSDLISRHTLEGVYLYASPACEWLIGYSPDELVGHSAFEFIVPEDASNVEQSRTAILDRQIVSTTVFRIRRKDGTPVWLETTSHAIHDPQTGDVLEIHAVTRDITERKRVEDLVREKMDELERFNRLMIGRELRMIELKQEINQLCGQLGQPPRYALEFVGDD